MKDLIQNSKLLIVIFPFYYTYKTKLETRSILLFDEETFFNIKTEFNPYWCFELSFIFNSNNLMNVITIDKGQ